LRAQLLLTDRKIKLAKTTSESIFLNDGLGLYLRVRASGSKVWLYRYKTIDKKTRWLELGTYPDMSLASARTAALNSKARRREGDDPVEIKKQSTANKKAKAAIDAARLTVKQLFDKWLLIELDKRKDKGTEIKRAFEKDVLPIIGEIFAESITRTHVTKILDEILSRGSSRMANRMLTDLRQMFGFGYVRGIIENDPTHKIRKADIGGKEVERDRVLSESEIKKLNDLLPNANLNKCAESAIWIALSTGCRIGELVSAKKQHIDLDKGEWLIPTENSKNSKTHTIYLSEFSKLHFQELIRLNTVSVWLFPNRADDNHLCLKTITKQIADRQRAPDKKPMKNRAKSSLALNLDNGKWTPHDLRRTAATMMGMLGVRPDVIEKCLNHVEQNKVTRIYQRQKLETEQAHAWRLLGDRLALLLNKNTSNISLISARGL